MTFLFDALRTAQTVFAAKDAGFRKLTELAGLDPARDWRGSKLSGVKFGTDNLSGFDFRDADVSGADFSRARGIRKSMFVGARTEGAVWPPGHAAVEEGWADDWGTDQRGAWVSFGVPGKRGKRISQRMRWIPPGRYMRGSPESEAGRDDHEGPRREVTIETGFWLFATPCTQALWTSVMGKNPSQFKTPARPVENVSFEDAEAFLKRINVLVPGLRLSLPSEACWEYACRGGEEKATWLGDLQILGENDAPLLDGIAWYRGNSGVGFEPKNGYDSSDWTDKQYPHDRAGTHPVGQKAPNPFGLYDMLGNVWERCADDWHDTYDAAPSDGSAWIDDPRSAFRVIRGGSWNVGARFVRAAFRSHFEPALHYDNLGFRCARVQAKGDEAERRAGRSERRERSEQAATTGPERRVGHSPRVRKA
jgi:formylglycine-generating enzyme required for sulfatase activity